MVKPGYIKPNSRAFKHRAMLKNLKPGECIFLPTETAVCGIRIAARSIGIALTQTKTNEGFEVRLKTNIQKG